MAKELKDKPRMSGLESFEKLSGEEMAAISKKLKKLIEKDDRIQGACRTLLLAQQLYYCGLHSLNKRMDQLQEKPELEAVLVHSMKWASTKVFSRRTVLDNIKNHALAWMLAEMAEESEREGKALQPNNRRQMVGDTKTAKEHK